MADPRTPNAAIMAIIRDLREVARNAMFRGAEMGDGYSSARALGLIEQVEVTKPCGACGTPKHDYTYSRVTLAGQAYLALALASGIVAATAGETEGLDERSEQSPVPKGGDAQTSEVNND